LEGSYAMIHPLTFLKGAGFGAGMMYFFDPVSGNRRRSLVRDQLVHACTVCDRQAGVTYRDASNRLQGAKAEISKAMQSSGEPVMERVQEGVMGVGRTLGMQGRLWSPTARAVAMIGGAGLIAGLMNKRDLIPLAFGALGLSFAAKELADREQLRSGQQRSRRGTQGQSTEMTNTQNINYQSQETNEGAGLEASVPIKKQPIHNL
jgi:hypothetical protein